MDEVLEPDSGETTGPKPRSSLKAKPTWSEYLETEDATRIVYLVFAFIAIAMVMTFLQFRTSGDLLRRLGRLLPHQLEQSAVGEFLARANGCRPLNGCR